MTKLGACVDTTLTWIGYNKLATFLGLVAFSLMVSTWTLAAINVNLNNEIDDLQRELHPETTTKAAEITTSAETTTTTVEPTTTTEELKTTTEEPTTEEPTTEEPITTTEEPITTTEEPTTKPV